MKRIKVNTHLEPDIGGKLIPISIVAYCNKCCGWKRNKPLLTEIHGHAGFFDTVDSKYGTCHRYPDAVTKCEDDWCGEFKPEIGDA